MAWRASGSSNEELVANLIAADLLRSDRIIAACRAVDRSAFVPAAQRKQAWEDRPFRLMLRGVRGGPAGALHLSAPHMYAASLEALQIQRGHAVLNVGSGSGYLSTLAAFLVGPAGRVDGTEVCENIVEYAQNSFRQFNSSAPEEEEVRAPYLSTAERIAHGLQCMLGKKPRGGALSYLDVVERSPSPSAAWATEWGLAERLGYVPPTPLQLAQRRLAFGMSQLPRGVEDCVTANANELQQLATDIIESIGCAAAELTFARVGCPVLFKRGNGLSIDVARNRKYDRIYCGAQGTRDDVQHLKQLLAPGGVLVGPFCDRLLRVSRSACGASFAEESLTGVRFGPLIRPFGQAPKIVVTDEAGESLEEGEPPEGSAQAVEGVPPADAGGPIIEYLFQPRRVHGTLLPNRHAVYI